MIRVGNGYILTETPTITTTFPDTVTAVSRPISAPKCSLLTNGQGGTISAWETQNNVYPIVADGSRVLGDNYEAAIISGAGPVTVDALHFVSGSAYSYADFVCKFKWYAVWEAEHFGWTWYCEYSYDDGATWSEPEYFGQIIYDTERDPTILKSFLSGSPNSYEKTYCLPYNGNYYHTLPYFGINAGSGSTIYCIDYASTLSESSNFAAIIKSEPIAHSDYLHTVSGVVT